MNLAEFLTTHRFPPVELFKAGISTKQFKALLNVYGSHNSHSLVSERQSYDRLLRALLVGSHFSHQGDLNDSELQKELLGFTAEQWQMSIRQHSFHRFFSALRGLELIVETMRDKHTDLFAIKGRMAAEVDMSGWLSQGYKSAERVASGDLLAYCSLMTAFIDTSRSMRRKLQEDSTNFDRAVSRVYFQKAKEISFLKDLRNCLLHYAIQRPQLLISKQGDRETQTLYLDASELLNVGFSWRRSSNSFLASRANEKVDITELTRVTVRNFEKQLELHTRVIVRKHKESREHYLNCISLWQKVGKQQREQMRRAFQLRGHWQKKRQ